MIEPDMLDRLRTITARTGLSKSEQIRQGILWWLESREWPSRRPARDVVDAGADVGSVSRKRR
jgi:hypothetical protein